MLISIGLKVIFYHDFLAGYLEYFTVSELCYEILNCTKNTYYHFLYVTIQTLIFNPFFVKG